jgi:hypothetical protein
LVISPDRNPFFVNNLKCEEVYYKLKSYDGVRRVSQIMPQKSMRTFINLKAVVVSHE